MVRMSSLDIRQWCALSSKLGEQHGYGKNALMGTCFHKCAANASDKHQWLIKLTDDEIQTVMSWKTPDEIEVGHLTLLYDDAQKEVEVGLDSEGNYCTRDDPNCVALGHIDFLWVVENDEAKTVYVGDIKKSEYTTESGPESLQLISYGYAAAQMVDADEFCCGIWAATEGTWWWGDMKSITWGSTKVWNRIKSAIYNEEVIMGSHCSRCYSRLHCSEYLLPAALETTSLAPLSTGRITHDNAMKLWNMVKAMEDMAKVGKDTLKEWSDRNGGIKDDSGKVLRAVEVKGRESVVSPEILRENMGKEAEQYIKRGKSYKTYKWLKEQNV